MKTKVAKHKREESLLDKSAELNVIRLDRLRKRNYLRGKFLGDKFRRSVSVRLRRFR